jgi:hypothetical protein
MVRKYSCRLWVILLGVLLLTGCTQGIPAGSSINSNAIKEFADSTIPLKVAELRPLNLSTIDTYEKYKSFADDTNDLIKILNEKTELFNIPKFEVTREAWEKVSKKITEYSPLINNYNNVVFAAKQYKQTLLKNDLHNFYTEAAVFGLEAGIIVSAVFYSAAFNAVGIAYRFVGLNRLALECGPCVSVILSRAHWAVRTLLVEGSAKFADAILDS